MHSIKYERLYNNIFSRCRFIRVEEAVQLHIHSYRQSTCIFDNFLNELGFLQGVSSSLGVKKMSILTCMNLRNNFGSKEKKKASVTSLQDPGDPDCGGAGPLRHHRGLHQSLVQPHLRVP